MKTALVKEPVNYLEDRSTNPQNYLKAISSKLYFSEYRFGEALSSFIDDVLDDCNKREVVVEYRLNDLKTKLLEEFQNATSRLFWITQTDNILEAFAELDEISKGIEE